MKNLKRFIASVLTFTILGTSVIFAANDSKFSDVDAKTKTGQAILKMYDKGYIVGYNDGTFKPDGQITRAELVRIINQVFGYKKDSKKEVKKFSDVDDKQWFYNDVVIANQKGYIVGFKEDGTFRPNDNFTRQQVCVVLSKILNLKDAELDREISDYIAPWAKEYVERIVANKIIPLESQNKFRAIENITRGEVCLALSQFIKDNTSENKQTNTDSTTETTTYDDGSSYSSSSGGGGGGGSSSGSSNNSTTEATTGTVTEAVTEAATSDVTTEPTTSSIVVNTYLSEEERNAVLPILKKVIRRINASVVPKASNKKISAAASKISNALQSYVNDAKFDVSSAMNDFKKDYDALSESEQEELKDLILKYNSLADLLTLKDTFLSGIF